MPRRFIRRTKSAFDSRTQEWRDVGLGSEIDRGDARRGLGGMVVAIALIVGVLVLFSERKTLFPGHGVEVRVATVVLLILLGWGLARSLGRGLGPPLYRRLDPGTAGTVGFLVRLLTIVRRGVVLLTNRPFRVGERIRLQAGALAGQTEGVVGQLGLFYTTLVSGADRTLVPNGVLIQSVVTPLREPDRVEFRARFDSRTTPREVQEMIENAITVPLRYPPHIAVEELDRSDVVVRIVTTPMNAGDGAKLAEEVLAGVRATAGAQTEPEPDSDGRGPTNEDRGSGPA